MLASVDSLKTDILALSPTMDEITGITNLVGVISSYMDNVQGGSMGSVGIFSLNKPIMIAGLSSLTPVNDNSWIPAFTLAFQNATEAAIITPGTVQNPVWLGSATLDTVTLPTGVATITTIPIAVADLTSKLNSAQSDDTAPFAMAQGINMATLDFIFTCIGLGVGPLFIPIPIPTSAE